MTSSHRARFAAVLFVVFISLMTAAQQTSSAPKAMGTIKSINGNSIVLTTDAGATVNVQVQDTSKLLRVAPGQDLKEASPLALQDLQAGDRILVRGKPEDSAQSLTASTLIAMKKADIAQKQQKDLQDWQRRGIGGLVKSVDPAAKAITISTVTAAGNKSVTIRLANNAVVRRYSPDSIKFDDAKVSTLEQIAPGDQLRARGSKNADGSELTADEIVAGTFRNIAGLISSVDAAKNTVTINDLATKKPVTVRITNDSQMHKLTPPIAQRLAARLKGEAQPGQSPSAPVGAPSAAGTSPSAQRPEGAPTTQGAPGEGGPRPGGGDVGQLLNRMPPVQFSELAKGEAVMIVATSGSATTDATAVSLLSGVEPLLTAAPNGAASLLTPWSLNTGAADAAGAGPQ